MRILSNLKNNEKSIQTCFNFYLVWTIRIQVISFYFMCEIIKWTKLIAWPGFFFYNRIIRCNKSSIFNKVIYERDCCSFIKQHVWVFLILLSSLQFGLLIFTQIIYLLIVDESVQCNQFVSYFVFSIKSNRYESIFCIKKK